MLGVLPLWFAASDVALPVGLGDIFGWVPLMPVGCCIILLAVLPTDAHLIHGLCHVAPLAILFVGGNEAVTAARLWGAGNDALAACFMALAALWLPALAGLAPTWQLYERCLSCSGHHGEHHADGHATMWGCARRRLTRLWLVLRGYLLASGLTVVAACAAMLGADRGTLGDPLLKSALGLAASCLSDIHLMTAPAPGKKVST